MEYKNGMSGHLYQPWITFIIHGICIIISIIMVCSPIRYGTLYSATR